MRDRVYHHIGDVPFLPVFDKPISDWGNALKAMFDAVVALALIVVAVAAAGPDRAWRETVVAAARSFSGRSVRLQQ